MSGGRRSHRLADCLLVVTFEVRCVLWVGVLRLYNMSQVENSMSARLLKGARSVYVCVFANVCVCGRWVGGAAWCLEGSLNLIVCRRLPSCFILFHFLSADSAGESWSGKHLPPLPHSHTHTPTHIHLFGVLYVATQWYMHAHSHIMKDTSTSFTRTHTFFTPYTT